MATWLALLLPACKESQEQTQSHSANAQYTCSMHPQVVEDEPGTCPICGMDLVKLTRSSASGNEVMLTESQIRLANITTGRAVKRRVGETLIINGTLSVDENKTEVISSRAAGRVERLYIRETGQHVRKGEPLYVLYSETLLTLQQEYLLAKEQYEALGGSEKRYRSFLDGAERKLRLYGLTKNQIEALTAATAMDAHVTFLSPADGIITDIMATEGQYLPEGQALYQLEDIRSLWVEAELYPGESSAVERGDEITVKVSGFESTPVHAKVTFVSPEYRSNSQVLIMRAAIENRDLRFKPGQHVQVFLSPSAREAIAVPVDAVIHEEKGSHVYVVSGRNTFMPRMIKTGLEGFDFVEVTEGLQEGDTVAVTGAYLLYSEIILKKGTDPMQAHNH